MSKGLIKALLPSGLRQKRTIKNLVERFGLKITGNDSPFQIIDSDFGQNCRLNQPVYIGKSIIGDYSYVEPYCRISACDIGKFTSIAAFSVLGPLSHPYTSVSTHPAFYIENKALAYHFVNESKDDSESLRTTIGNDVWIGSNVFIKRGLNIGTGAVIGAGSVVTKDLPPYAIAVGAPAKILKFRFEQSVIDGLLASRWWDKDSDWLRSKAHLFTDPATFLADCEKDLS